MHNICINLEHMTLYVLFKWWKKVHFIHTFDFSNKNAHHNLYLWQYIHNSQYYKNEKWLPTF